MKNLVKQNFLEQQLLLKEIELEAHGIMTNKLDKSSLCSHWNWTSQAIIEQEIKIMEMMIDVIKKENFPNGICNWCGFDLKDGKFELAEDSPFSYCNEGCKNLHEDMILKKEQTKK